MSLDSVTVVIRSVGERTESLCRKLILDQGVPEKAVFVINEAPFSKAMKVGFEIGIFENRPWTCCVDADLLLRQGSISRIIKQAESMDSKIFEVHGYILDKFYGNLRPAGFHHYRTKLLNKAVNLIPDEGTDIRPETYVLNAMKSAGNDWKLVRELIGLHDFEQSYDDIFRKCFVHAHKHLKNAYLHIPEWRSKVTGDLDFKVALLGFSEGIKHYGDVRIDVRESYFKDAFRDLEILKKHEINHENWGLERVEQIVQSELVNLGYKDSDFSTDIFKRSKIIEKMKECYISFRASNSRLDSWVLVFAWLIEGLGKNISSGIIHNQYRSKKQESTGKVYEKK